jgi:hypothetical protein
LPRPWRPSRRPRRSSSSAGRGRAILSSSRDSESSYLLPGAANSLFTRHLFEYVQPRVTRDQPSQHPVFRADREENFPVALARTGDKGPVPRDEDGFRYDAYLSYVDRAPDSVWVWETLIPRLERAGLRLVVSGASPDPGVPVVVSVERGIRQAKARAIVTPSYGHGRVDPGKHGVAGTKCADLRAKRVTVHPYVYMPYTFTGRFRKEKTDHEPQAQAGAGS